MADTRDTPADEHHDTPNPRPNTADDEESILRELNAALAANPALRAATPQPAGDGEWEDFQRLLAENPELAAPVVAAGSGSGPKEYYKSKDQWECGHEGEETPTEIERDPSDGTPAVLVNEVRGICEKCMARWVKLEEAASGAGSVGLGGSSSGPAGPPAYDQAPIITQGLEVEDDDDLDDDQHDERHPHGVFEVDDGPGKGKSVPGQAPRYFAEPDSDDNDESLYSDSNPGDPNDKLPGSRPNPLARAYADDDDDDDSLMPVPLHVRRPEDGSSNRDLNRSNIPPHFRVRSFMSDDEDDDDDDGRAPPPRPPPPPAGASAGGSNNGPDPPRY